MTDEPKLTIQQFKAWLEGVEEMQDDDWTPSDVQWKKIRSKIAKLCEDMQTTPIQPPQMTVPPTGPMYRAPIAFPERNPRPIESIPVVPAIVDVPQSSILTDEVIQPSRRAPSNILETAPTVKTPNIDTSGGGYKSTFE